MVKTWTEEAFGGEAACIGVLDSFGEIMHVACPIIEVFANTATSAGGFGARGGRNVGSQSKIVRGPAVFCLASEAAIFIPLLEILSVVVMCRICAYGLECEVALIPPEPCPSRYDVV